MYGLYQRMPQPLNQTIILSPELRSNGFLLFQTDVELQMRKPMHSKSVQKWPLRAKFGYGCTSGSFLTMYVELRAADTEEPMMKMLISLAYVDNRTRKLASSFPQWFTTAMDGKHGLEEGLKIERLRARPKETYLQKMMVSKFYM